MSKEQYELLQNEQFAALRKKLTDPQAREEIQKQAAAGVKADKSAFEKHVRGNRLFQGLHLVKHD